MLDGASTWPWRGQNLAKMDVFGGLEASADDFTRDIQLYLVLFVHLIAFAQMGAAAGAQGCSGFYMVGVIPFYKASKNKYILFFV